MQNTHNTSLVPTPGITHLVSWCVRGRRGTPQRYVSKNQTSLRIFAAIIFSVTTSIVQAGQEAQIRGVLVWTKEKQTMTDCKSGRVYWVRVLASNPYFLLTKKVEELTLKSTENIVSEFRGEINLGIPSSGPRYPVDGTLNVHQIISVTHGSCDK